MASFQVAIILGFSLIGIAGSYGVAWFGIRVNTFANSRTAFASLRGKPFPCYAIPLKAGMSIGMMLISVELLIMLCILLFIPGDYAGPCFIGFAIGESLGAAALRVAGGIFTKIADIGADLMKIVFKIKEDDARNPGVIADCTGDNAGDSVGPSADGFETYGVTGVALINFIILAVTNDITQVQLLVWIFAMRVMMIIASALSYFINEAVAKAKYQNLDKMNYEHPLTSLVWLTSFISIGATYALSYVMIPDLGGDPSMWWKLSTIITCGTLAGAIIPELVKVFTSVESSHVKEVVTSSREGGASLNILSGLVAGNFSAFWLGMTMMALMAIAYYVSGFGMAALMLAPAVFAFGLVAFGFLGMGPVTIAVDSYGPVTDNAQSVYELSQIEEIPNIKAELKNEVRLRCGFREGQASPGRERRRRQHLQGDGEAGADRHGRGGVDHHDLLDHHSADQPFAARTAGQPLDPVCTVPAGSAHGRRGDLLVHRRVDAGGHHRRLPRGRVHQSQHQAGRRHQGLGHGFEESGRDLHPVRAEGHVQHLPDGVLRDPGIRLRRAVLLHRLPDFHRAVRVVPGHLHGQRGRRVGQRQEDRGSDLKAKGTPLHDATVVGDTVGDPFKDTSSVALNPIIKFTTLFGLLAVELAVSWTKDSRRELHHGARGGVPGHRPVLRMALLLRDADRGKQKLGASGQGQLGQYSGGMRTLAPFLFGVTLSAATIPDLAELNRMIARYAPVELHADASKLSAGDQKALAKLLDAARVIDDIFLKQVWSGNVALRAKLAKDTSPLGKARLHYFDLNKGPWSELDEQTAFLPGVPEKKLPGANFYPEGMTKQAFEEWDRGSQKPARTGHGFLYRDRA